MLDLQPRPPTSAAGDRSATPPVRDTAPAPAVTRSAPPPAPPALSLPPVADPPVRKPRRRRRWLAVAGLLVVALGAGLLLAHPPTPPPAAPAAVTAATKLTARGQVRPVGQARVGTLNGGTLAQLLVEVGQPVAPEQEIARVRGPNGTEVVTAPWRGNVMSLPAHLGDTLLPGAAIATVGDMARLQVETTDLDEFLIARVARGTYVTLTVDALDSRQLGGVVRSVTLEPQTTATGDDFYPVVIDLSEQPPDLRVGMTVRITLDE